MTDAALLAAVFSAEELGDIKDACKSQIISGGASQAFVVSSSVGGRSVTLQQTYSAWDMLRLAEEAMSIKSGFGNSRCTQAAYGSY